jgi:hypothetical protein
MFKNSMQGISTLSYALCSSLSDIVEQNTLNESLDDNVTFFDEKKGDIYIPLTKKFWRSQITDKKFPNFFPISQGKENDLDPDDADYGGTINSNTFRRDYLKDQITTISFNKSLNLNIFLEQISNNENIYGVLIENTANSKSNTNKYMFNPLHPINAFMVLTGLIKLPEEGNLHIFEYNDYSMEQLKEFKDNGNLEANIEKYQSDYNNLFSTISPFILDEKMIINQKAEVDDYDVTSIIDSPFLEAIDVEVNITKKTVLSDGYSKIKSMVIPTQMLASGIATPYYGLILVNKPTDYENLSGMQLSPMITGNINSSFRSTYKEQLNFTCSGNICTGSQNPSTRKGWLTLSKVNLSSMFFDDIIDSRHVLQFATASKSVSNKIWKTICANMETEMEKAVSDD